MENLHAKISPAEDRSSASAVASGSGSRFVDPRRVLGEAESWMQDVEMVDEEDRTEDESYALALWDELRRLRHLCLEALAMADAWQDADGAPASDLVRRLRRAVCSPNTQGLVTPGTGQSDESAAASRRHQ